MQWQIEAYQAAVVVKREVWPDGTKRDVTIPPRRFIPIQKASRRVDHAAVSLLQVVLLSPPVLLLFAMLLQALPASLFPG